jgi:preprotein translocase subunit YajC
VELLPLIALFAVFWLLLIRPQQKRRKEQQAMVASLKAGDDIVTIGGLYGRVVAVDETTMDLEVTADSDVVLRFERSSLGRIVAADTPPTDDTPMTEG